MARPYRQYYPEFVSARLGALRRGVEFKLTFDEWLAIWKKSKRLHLRGRGIGKYCMARFGDKGPYKVGNVKIILHNGNVKEGWTNASPKQLVERKLSAAKGGYKNKGNQRPDLSARNKTKKMIQSVKKSWKTRQPRTGWSHSESTRQQMSESAKLARSRQPNWRLDTR